MSTDNKPIFVTQPFLPPIEEFNELLLEIWQSKWLTNNGKFHQKLESSLCDYLGVRNLSLFSNGTLALITAMQSLKLTGEVITTPFSFVATSHALHWNGIKPVFVDIEPRTFNIDPSKIEAAITDKTTAILPVHVYGNPCDIEAIQKIADKHHLKVIYDAAHTFGVIINGSSILNAGDLSILSFHATKVFSTLEGGAIVMKTPEMKTKIDQLKNFGFVDEVTITEVGINAKMNEVQAAFGLLQLKYVDELIKKRKYVADMYKAALVDIDGLYIIPDIPGVRHNYSYFPVLFDDEKLKTTRDDVYNHLKAHDIFSRRYFYPLISNLSVYNSLDSASESHLPVANWIAKQVLCLPIYADLAEEDVERIIGLIREKI